MCGVSLPHVTPTSEGHIAQHGTFAASCMVTLTTIYNKPFRTDKRRGFTILELGSLGAWIAKPVPPLACLLASRLPLPHGDTATGCVSPPSMHGDRLSCCVW
jgi:hypothetical protein